MDVEGKLQQLGLDEREAVVYLTLLDLKEAPVAAVIEKTGLHRELVYGALKRLEARRLVRPLERAKIRHYVAEDPRVLVDQERVALELAKAVLKPLRQRYSEPPVSVRTFEGSAGYEEIQIDIQRTLKRGEHYLVIGAAGAPWYTVTQGFYKTYRRKCLRRGIHAKMITYENELPSLLESELPGFAEVRVLPQRFAVPSSTKVYADKVILQVFGERPLAIQVQSQAIVTSYRQHFATLWTLARPITRATRGRGQ